VVERQCDWLVCLCARVCRNGMIFCSLGILTYSAMSRKCEFTLNPSGRRTSSSITSKPVSTHIYFILFLPILLSSVHGCFYSKPVDGLLSADVPLRNYLLTQHAHTSKIANHKMSSSDMRSFPDRKSNKQGQCLSVDGLRGRQLFVCLHATLLVCFVQSSVFAQ